MTYDGIRFFYDYNNWATNRLFEALEQITPEQYNVAGCSGNGSIRETLAHLFAVQYSWFSWYEGSMKVEDAIRYTIPGEEIATIPHAKERWNTIVAKAEKYLASLSEEKLNSVKSWSMPNMNGGTELWRLLLHTANHGTHTRAQIIAAIRRAGYNPGSIDMMMFVLSQPGVVK